MLQRSLSGQYPLSLSQKKMKIFPRKDAAMATGGATAAATKGEETFSIKYDRAYLIVDQNQNKVEVKVELFPSFDPESDIIGAHYTFDGWKNVMKSEEEWVPITPPSPRMSFMGNDDSEAKPTQASVFIPVPNDIVELAKTKLWFALYAVKKTDEGDVEVWDNNKGWNYQVLPTRLPCPERNSIRDFYL